MQAGRCSLVITTRRSLAVLTISSAWSQFVWSRFIFPSHLWTERLCLTYRCDQLMCFLSSRVFGCLNMSWFFPYLCTFWACVFLSLSLTWFYIWFGKFTDGIWCDHSEKPLRIAEDSDYSLHLCYNRDREDLTVFSFCSRCLCA